MKFIVKNDSPPSLTKWYGNEKGLNRSYKKGSLTSSILEDVKKSLLDEQGYICCYTGKRIDLKSSHIEHLTPQTVSRNNRKNGIEDYNDVKYQNMLAAYPFKLFETDAKTGKEKHVKCKFGAEAREDKILPVNPLQENCQQRFSFDALGNILPISKTDTAAEDTIKILKLNDEDLIRERRAVFAAVLSQKNLSEALTRKAAETAMERDSERRFKAFCFVLKVACELRLKKTEREQKDKKYSRRAKNQK